MTRVAFLSTTGLEDFFVYDELAIEPLAALGVSVDTVPWRAAIDWSTYDAVVVRSTWDYQDDVDAFVRTLERIDTTTRLFNPLDAMRWNVDKRYLLELQAAGVPIVPTRVVDGLTVDHVPTIASEFDADELVVKPTISANADDTFRVRVDDTRAIAAAVVRLERRPTLVQPFVRSIVDEGEISTFHFGGEYSHAIRKTPGTGDFRVQEEHGGSLAPVDPDATLRALGDRVLAALPGDLVYARLDFVRLAHGGHALIEAELIEPSLYFQLDAESPWRFGRALVGAMGP